MKTGLAFAIVFCAMLTSALAQEATDDYEPPEAPIDNTSNGWEYDWSGSYFGLNAGYAIGSHDTLGIGGINTGARDLSGQAMGLFMGQNYNISRIVVGSEMDFSKAAITGPFDLPGSTIACNQSGFSCATDIGWYGTLRARAGVSIGDFLPYATAGIAVGGVKTNYSGPSVDTSVSGLGLGWVLGAGLEYAVMKNINVRAEALHFNLSDVADKVLGTNVSTDTNFTVLRTGVSLKF